MDAEFCKYMMGSARFQALAEAFTKLYAARDLVGARIVQDMLHEENVKSNVKPRCGLDDPTWFTEKMQEFDKHEESRDYGTAD